MFGWALVRCDHLASVELGASQVRECQKANTRLREGLSESRSIRQMKDKEIATLQAKIHKIRLEPDDETDYSIWLGQPLF